MFSFGSQMSEKKCKYIFITGGVVSGIGKGVTMASIAAILRGYGYKKLFLKKLDPYLNIDPGTMNPMEHGEVYVTEDGVETDLDLGHYERFTEIPTNVDSNTTSGKLYQTVLENERRGKYLGKTVQMIPHLTDLIKEFITKGEKDSEFILCEIGGSVGDIEAMLFFESLRQLKNELGSQNTIFIHVTYIPFIRAVSELKTKPTQESVKKLMSLGIQPSFLVCRTEYPLTKPLIDKLSMFTNVSPTNIIEAIDVDNIYKVPICYSNQNLGEKILQYFRLKTKKLCLKKWHDLVNHDFKFNNSIKISIIGKYVPCKDAYKSLVEAINHAGYSLKCNITINWVNSKTIDIQDLTNQIKSSDGIVIPGGFGEEGISNKLKAIQISRENNIPFLGICLGMQLAVIEFAQNVAKITNAFSSEFSPGDNNIVGLMTEWKNRDGENEIRTDSSPYGGTMRLGSYEGKISSGSLAHKIYGKLDFNERHRHRYEINSAYIKILEPHGLIFSGMSTKENLPEILEITEYINNAGTRNKLNFFIGCQFHPEYKSTPFSPRPLFIGLVKAAMNL